MIAQSKLDTIDDMRVRMAFATLGKNIRFAGIDNEKLLSGIDALAERLLALHEQIETRKRAILGDQNLSQKGRHDALTKLKEQAAAELDGIEAKLSFQTQSDGIRAKMNTPPTVDGDPPVNFLRESEVRAKLERLKSHEVNTLYFRACESGSDPLVIRAIENAPLAFPILGEEEIERGRMARFPEVAAMLEQIQAAERIAAGLISVLRSAT